MLPLNWRHQSSFVYLVYLLGRMNGAIVYLSFKGMCLPYDLVLRIKIQQLFTGRGLIKETPSVRLRTRAKTFPREMAENLHTLGEAIYRKF